MKKLEDLIPFCVSTEGLTEEQGEELYNKFIKVGAAIYEGSLNKNYHWFGVDSIGDIVNYDYMDSFDYNYTKSEYATVVVPYEEVDEFLGLVSSPEIQEVKPTTNKIEFSDFIKQHDGITLLIKYFDISPEEAEKAMISGLIYHLSQKDL
jgi:hypothetical protein